jgi:phage baseplate assembly protein W
MSFYGAPYPIIRTPRGLLATQEGLSQIKSDLLVLLMTNPGERIMLPEFGTPLRTLIFEQNDVVVVQQATQMISDSITRWEPRITVSDISVSVLPQSISNPLDAIEDASHVLYINIKFFDPQTINQIQDLKLQLPIGN